MDFSPQCQQRACQGRMRALAPALDSLADEELWFECEECGVLQHSLDLPHGGFWLWHAWRSGSISGVT